jgi:uncharacterized protein YcbX
VKSLLGESLEALDLDERGVVGDRVWSVRTADDKIGSGKRTRRFDAIPGLLQLRGRTTSQGVRVALPGGDEWAVEEAGPALSSYLGRQVSTASETDVSHFDDGPVSLLSMASVHALGAEVGADVDPSRFRANIHLDGLPAFGEDALVGRRIRLGDVTLEVEMRSPRCVMIDMGTAVLPEQHGNLKTIGRLNEACLGVIARVVVPGRVHVGDALVG